MAVCPITGRIPSPASCVSSTQSGRILLRHACVSDKGKASAESATDPISRSKAVSSVAFICTTGIPKIRLTLELTLGFILVPMAEAVHIGQAAKLAGISVDAIRFYQKLGLLINSPRTPGGYRLFSREQIRDLTFVRHAQELGFSLAEIKELLSLRQREHICPEVHSLLERKLTDVRSKITSLTHLEEELNGALRDCKRELRHKGVKHEECCPLINKLEHMNGANGKQHAASTNRRARK
jgi:MerR family copper efflux transcriptional regulator